MLGYTYKKLVGEDRKLNTLRILNSQQIEVNAAPSQSRRSI